MCLFVRARGIPSRVRPILLLLGVAAVLAACGRDSGDADVQDYRDQVQEGCREAERDAERLAREVGGDVAEYFRRTLPLARREQRRFEEIEAPHELARQHEQAILLGRRALSALEDLTEELEASERPLGVLRRELPPLLELVDRSNELSRAMKLDDCVSEISAAPAPQAPS